MAVKKGEWIKVEYEGTFDDGTIFDSTELNGGIPLKFQVGVGQLVKGFDESVMGKELGEDKRVHAEKKKRVRQRPEVAEHRAAVPRLEVPCSERRDQLPVSNECFDVRKHPAQA